MFAESLQGVHLWNWFVKSVIADDDIIVKPLYILRARGTPLQEKQIMSKLAFLGISLPAKHFISTYLFSQMKKAPLLYSTVFKTIFFFSDSEHKSAVKSALPQFLQRQ